MSDFLSNLAAKSLGVADVLQPRLESLFEPARKGKWPFSEDSDSEDERFPGPEAHGVTRQIPLRVGDRFQSQPPETISGQQLDTAHLHQLREPASTFHQNPQQDLSLSPPESAEAKPPFSPKAPLEPLQPATKPGFGQAAKGSAVLPPATGVKTENKSSGDSSSRGEGVPPKPPWSLGSDAVVTRLKKDDRSEFKPPPARTFIQPITSAVIWRASAPRDTGKVAPFITGLADTPDAGPTINVTIGRIEVKAMPPPAQVPRRKRTAPSMTLDEYLRQRTKGTKG